MAPLLTPSGIKRRAYLCNFNYIEQFIKEGISDILASLLNHIPNMYR